MFFYLVLIMATASLYFTSGWAWLAGGGWGTRVGGASLSLPELYSTSAVAFIIHIYHTFKKYLLLATIDLVFNVLENFERFFSLKNNLLKIENIDQICILKSPSSLFCCYSPARLLQYFLLFHNQKLLDLKNKLNVLIHYFFCFSLNLSPQIIV